MKSCLGILGGGLLVVIALLCFVLFGSSTTTIPNPPPPAGAKDVHFHERSAWQTWDYEYRFDAPAGVCEAFAIELMKRQSFKTNGAKITKSEFTEFPIGSHFQPWFDVGSV